MPPDELYFLTSDLAAAWANVRRLAQDAGKRRVRSRDLNNNSGAGADVKEVQESMSRRFRKQSARRALAMAPSLPASVLRRRGSDDVADDEFLYTVLACSNCSDLFPTRNELLLHRLQAHHLQPHQCPDCMATFALADLLDQHLLTHTPSLPHACSHAGCGKRFSLKAHVKTHERALHPLPRGPEHRCATCAKVFQSATRLSNHMAYHSDERPFACDVCQSTFKNRSTLSRHMNKSHPQVIVVE